MRRTFARQTQQDQTVEAAAPAKQDHAPARHRPGVDALLDLQGTIGNQAILDLLSQSEPDRAQPRPRIRAARFAPQTGSDAGDKSLSGDAPVQDQNISLAAFKAAARGVDIVADAENMQSSTDYPDGYRWTQTITTNYPRGKAPGDPLLATPVTYVDPTPNDDTKPFYLTDAEFAKLQGIFVDHPRRKADATSTVHWDAILSLCGVNGKSVERFDSLSYGFSIATDGTVTENSPTSPADVSGHLGALSAAFPDWSFV